MKNVILFTNIPSPYRIEFFNELGKFCKLTVVFEAQYNPNINIRWRFYQIHTFQAIFLKQGAIREKKINWKILKYVEKNKESIIIFTNYAYFTEMIALLYAKIRGIPYILEVDGALSHQENTVKSWYKSLLIKKAEIYLSPSKTTDNVLKRYGADPKKIYRYPFTSLKKIDFVETPITQQEKSDLRRKFNIGKRYILSVGQFIPRKGFDILIRAFSKVSVECDLYIIGGIPTVDYIYLLDCLQLKNVHFLDFKKKEELELYYKGAELFVFPTREDVWGLVINEAMAKGLPVITTDNCVAGLELVENGVNGYLVPVDDVESLAQRINDVLSNEELRTSMAYASLKKIKNYTIENMVKKHIQILGLEG